MHFSVSNRRASGWHRLALASVLSTCLTPVSFAQAQDDKALPTVVVTASRFATDPANLPIGSSVITADEIRAAGIDNVNQAVRKLGGVYGRQGNYGTQDFDLDLRGFGINSAQNIVVLLDGVRLSENEQSVALLSSIPIDMVERVEIIRGGSSVLYGDGATGGVIHVITKRNAAAGTHGSLIAEAGQFNHRELRAFVAQGWEGFSITANASKMKTDNYRDNQAVDQENFGVGMQWASRDARIGLRVDGARQDSRLPGALTLAQFNADPRQTVTPNDRSSIDTDRVIAFAERRFGEWEAAVELSNREKKVDSFLSGSNSKYNSYQTQFSPRLRHLHAVDGWANEFVAGFDFSRWHRDTDSAYSLDDARQWSRAAYVRDELKWGPARLTGGVRHETFDQKSNDPAPYTTADYRKEFSVNAWELQGSYSPSSLVTLFAKAGQSYRVANVDDNAYTAVDNQPLKPQTSHDLELGASVGNRASKVTAKLFQHRLRNEIFYDPTPAPGRSWGSNVNLDPTQRQGIEVEGSARLAPAWMLKAMWQHVKAEFTDGPYDGREMVMVPKNVVTARLNWLPAAGHSASIGAQWVSEQRYGGDFANTCSSQIPSYTLLDARYAFRTGPWEFAVAGENLTDKDYFNNAYGCRSGIYPNAGRQLKLSARYDF